MDYCILLDSTGSMDRLINGAKAYCVDTINEVKSGMLNDSNKLRIACICYRDPVDCEMDNHEFIDFTEQAAELQTFLETQSAYSGGDLPEDIHGALEIALNRLSWEPTTFKMITICSDAPAHGIRFSGINKHQDREEKLVKIIEEIAKKNITLNLIGLHRFTRKCFLEIKKIYDEHQDCGSCTVKFIDLHEQGDAERGARVIGHTIATHARDTAMFSATRMNSELFAPTVMNEVDIFEGRCISPPPPMGPLMNSTNAPSLILIDSDEPTILKNDVDEIMILDDQN